MMSRYLFAILFQVCCLCRLTAQKHVLNHYSVAVTTMHTNLPFHSFSSLFTKEYHPGVELGTGFSWKQKTRHDWYQELSFAYSYHRWVQHTICLYSAVGYRYKFPKGFTADASIGAGYLHAIADSKLFKLQPDGTYKKKFNGGRAQAMAAFTIGIGKSFASGNAIFLRYQQRVQTPFIKSYVPVLPSNLLMLGLTVALHKANNK